MENKTLTMLVLAGGFGTRLQSIVADLPKALAPVEGKPFLYYILKSWIDQGVRSFSFLLHYKADLIIQFLNSQKNDLLKDVEFNWTIESQPLGTGGSISNALRELHIEGAFLVCNADTWLNSGVKEIVETGDTPRIAIIELKDTNRFGRVVTEEDKIVAFLEKVDTNSSGWINAGLYCLHSDQFRNWDGKPFSLESEMFPLLANAGKLYATPLESEFIDIGIPDDYKKFIDKVKADIH